MGWCARDYPALLTLTNFWMALSPRDRLPLWKSLCLQPACDRCTTEPDATMDFGDRRAARAERHSLGIPGAPSFAPRQFALISALRVEC